MAIHFADRRKLRRIINIALMAAAMTTAGAIAQFSRPSPLYLGFIGPLTGIHSDLGQAGRDGTILAVEECNDGGGIQDHPVEVLIHDDSASPASIGPILSSLAAHGAQAAVGPMLNEQAIFASIESQRHGILLMSPGAGADELTGRDDLFFRLYPSCDELMDHLARYMHGRRNLMQPAVIVDEALGDCGLQMAADFAKAYASFKGKPLSITRYSSAGEGPIRDAAQRAAADKPDSVLILAGPEQTGMLCQYLRQAGCNAPLAATELAAGEGLVVYGGSAAEGVFFFHSFDRYYPSERYESFRQRFRRRFGREPTFAAVHAFDSARILLTAIAERGFRADLKQAISGMHFFEGVQGRITLLEMGDVRQELFLSTVRNGAFRAME